MVNRFSKQTLQALCELDIDWMSRAHWSGEDVIVSKGGLLGFWSKQYGLLLEPKYTELQCFDDSEFIKVGLKVDSLILYGAYSKTKRAFAMQPVHPLRVFWSTFLKLKNSK